jgi:hypothetical protein
MPSSSTANQSESGSRTLKRSEQQRLSTVPSSASHAPLCDGSVDGPSPKTGSASHRPTPSDPELPPISPLRIITLVVSIDESSLLSTRESHVRRRSPRPRCRRPRCRDAVNNHANISTSSRYLKPSKLALHTTIRRIDEQRRQSGEAAKWERELAEIRTNVQHGAQKGHKLLESTRQRKAEDSVTASKPNRLGA